MQRAFDKIIERLRDSGERYEDIAFAEMNENGQTLDFEYAHGKKDAMLESIEIVNQVASEYFKENYFNLDNTKLHDCPKCGEKATHRVNKKGSWACGCFKCGLFKSSYDHVKAIQAWEDYCGEYDGGWIPVSSGKLPEENIAVDVTIKEEIEGSTYTDVSWLQEGQWVIKKNPFRPRVTAWKMRLEPYQPKFEFKCANPPSPELIAEVHDKLRKIEPYKAESEE